MRLSPAPGMEGREKAKKKQQQQKNTLLVRGRDPQARGAAVWLVGMRSISQRTHTCTCRNGFFPCELVLGKLVANLSAIQTIKVAEERDQSLLRGGTSDMGGYLF